MEPPFVAALAVIQPLVKKKVKAGRPFEPLCPSIIAAYFTAQLFVQQSIFLDEASILTDRPDCSPFQYVSMLQAMTVA